MAPAIAALAREGHDVTIVFATIGDQGPGVTSLPRGAALGEIRRGGGDMLSQGAGGRSAVPRRLVRRHSCRHRGNRRLQVLRPGTSSTSSSTPILRPRLTLCSRGDRMAAMATPITAW